MNGRELGHIQIENDVITVREVKLPDEQVKAFLETLDARARQFYRHEPNEIEEIQWFAFHEERMVAYGSLQCVTAGECIFGCVVHQDYRGKGLGKLMYRFATDLAIRHRRTVITAEQDNDNLAARAICEAEEFEFSEPIPDPASSSGMIVRLRKEIKWQ